MKLKDIEYFLRIVDEGSLSRAAESLYLTQPALSRFLARLEEGLGTRLFLRKPDSTLELTEAGKHYLQAARKIDRLWRGMEASLDEIGDAHRNRICFGFDDDAMYNRIQTAAAAIAEKFPHISLESHCLNSTEIQTAILEGRIDMGFTSFFTLNKHLTYIPLLENEIDLVVSKHHPLAQYSYQLPGQQDTRIRLDSLPADTEFLLMRKGYVLRQRVDSYMAALPWTPRVTSTYFRLDLLGNILAENQSLVGFCPRNRCFPELSYIALDPPFFHTRGICYRKGKQLTAPEKILMQMLEG